MNISKSTHEAVDFFGHVRPAYVASEAVSSISIAKYHRRKFCLKSKVPQRPQIRPPMSLEAENLKKFDFAYYDLYKERT